MAHVLYVIHGSHPCRVAAAALDLKGQPYRVVELAPALHRLVQRARFGRSTVPALALGSGERIVGSRAIVHRLDELIPDPPLLPADADARERVLAVERWGDEVLQPVARRLSWNGLRRRPDAMASYAAGSRLPLPAPLRALVTPPLARVAGAVHGASDDVIGGDLAALPAQLDAIDRWIAEGVLGGPQPNAADLQVASSVRLLATFADLHPLLTGRPALTLAYGLFPQWAGEMPRGTFTI